MPVKAAVKPKNISTYTSAQLQGRYLEVRRVTEALCRPLAIEDYGVQAMAEVSPPKWHLAHTSWFFERFVLNRFNPSYRAFHPQFEYLFNSYYESVGSFWPRPKRGLLSRPTVKEVYTYRAHVDEAMQSLLAVAGTDFRPEVERLTVLGLNHEQQHQELFLMDIKYNFFVNPLRPAYVDSASGQAFEGSEAAWLEHAGGVHEIGHSGDGFAFDNESPRHRVHVEPYKLASRPVLSGEYLAFIEDGGYQRPELWLSDGWATVGQGGWRAPLYWLQEDGIWYEFTLSGLRPINLHAPVCHISFYEADAYARWSGRRLPTEAEWELAACDVPIAGNFVESGALQPLPAASDNRQFFGDVWEWTASAYRPYPGYRPQPGALGEYNGKFMCNQMVLRGGCCATPQSHMRVTYRNFYYPRDRWPFAGMRLADDC